MKNHKFEKVQANEETKYKRNANMKDAEMQNKIDIHATLWLQVVSRQCTCIYI